MNTITSEDKLNVLKRQLLISGSCLVIVLVLFFVLSKAQYVAPEMKVDVDYEPAIFNTVLLGKLVDSDLAAAVSDNAGEKLISTSLSLTDANELSSNDSIDQTAFRPGKHNHLYFAVTNGTTIEGVSPNIIVADETSKRSLSGNVAGTDIVYTLEIITTMNLPLEYTLYDQFTGESFSVSTNTMKNNPDDIEEVGGYCNVFTVSGSATSPNTADFTADGKRLLKSYGDSVITIHNYLLDIYWPTQDNTELLRYVSGNETVVTWNSADLRNPELMKEIENIQIKLDVASYVDNSADTSKAAASTNTARGILALSTNITPDTTVLGNYDQVMSANRIKKFNAVKKVAYDNFSENQLPSDSAELKKLKNCYTNWINSWKVYTYDFTVRNCSTISANWDANSKKYTYQGDYGSYSSCRLAIGAATSNNAVQRDYVVSCDYFIGYDSNKDGIDDTFYGADCNSSKATAGHSLSANYWDRTNWTADNTDYTTFEEHSDTAYYFSPFSKCTNVTQGFSSKSYSERQYTLYMVDKGNNFIFHKSKDVFYLYAYTTK